MKVLNKIYYRKISVQYWSEQKETIDSSFGETIRMFYYYLSYKVMYFY